MPRPLLIGFKLAENSDAILDKAFQLSKKDESWSNNIVRDLTKGQRKEEGRMTDRLAVEGGRSQRRTENCKSIAGTRGDCGRTGINQRQRERKRSGKRPFEEDLGDQEQEHIRTNSLAKTNCTYRKQFF